MAKTLYGRLYEETERGPRLEGFTGWIREHWPLIVDARRTFDEARASGCQPAPHAPM